MKLYEKINSIESKSDFLEFLLELQKDSDLNTQEWENKDIADYLGGIRSWIEDMDGYFLNSKKDIPSNINWGFIATLFYVGKLYE